MGRRSPAAPPPIYAIADVETLGEKRVVDSVEIMARAGIRWIQLRAKEIADQTFFELAEQCSALASGIGFDLWVNDRSEIAAMVGAAGVHLGEDDLPPAAARRVVGEDLWIGLSTHDETQVGKAAALPEVDVVAYGPISATSSKRDPDPPVGLASLRRVRRLTAKPLVAVGGIDAENACEVLAAGADAVAVIGAICHGNVAANAAEMLAAVREVRV